MKSEDIEAQELQALYDEKRDKLNARLPVWSLLLTLFGAVGYASVQAGLSGYLGILYPPLAATIARFTGHSERVLDRVKRRIHAIEEASGYHGYEHENAARTAKGSGGHVKALRDFILLTDALDTVITALRLIEAQMTLLAVLLIFGELVVMAATWRWLDDQPAHQEQPKGRSGARTPFNKAVQAPGNGGLPT